MTTSTQAKAENASMRGYLAALDRAIDLTRSAISHLEAAQQAIGSEAARAAAQGRLSSDLMRAVGMVTDPAARTEKGER